MIRNYQESSASQSMSQAENSTQATSQSSGGKRGLHIAANCQSGYYFAVAFFMASSVKIAVSSLSTSMPIAWSAQVSLRSKAWGYLHWLEREDFAQCIMHALTTTAFCKHEFHRQTRSASILGCKLFQRKEKSRSMRMTWRSNALSGPCPTVMEGTPISNDVAPNKK